MLAQNFKTAAELGISEIEWSSLVATLFALQRGEVGGLNMGMYRHDCGTPACLCGWAHHLSEGRAFPELANVRGFFGHDRTNEELAQRLPRELSALFGITLSTVPRPTTDQAAIALRGYLTTGRQAWAEACAAASQ